MAHIHFDARELGHRGLSAAFFALESDVDSIGISNMEEIRMLPRIPSSVKSLILHKVDKFQILSNFGNLKSLNIQDSTLDCQLVPPATLENLVVESCSGSIRLGALPPGLRQFDLLYNGEAQITKQVEERLLSATGKGCKFRLYHPIASSPTKPLSLSVAPGSVGTSPRAHSAPPGRCRPHVAAQPGLH